MLPLLLSGYLFLLIFRPYEYWTILGELRVERIYVLIFMSILFFTREKRFISSPINGAVVCLTLTLLLSGIFGINWSNSWPFIIDYIKYVIFYFMVILSVRNEEDFRLVLLAFVAVMFIYVGKSAWEFFVHDRYIFRMGIKRMCGIDVTYSDPNSFAASICYSLPLAWAMIRSKFQHAWVTRFLWAYGLLALTAIMFTGSRSGMVAFLLFLLLLVMGSSRKVLGILLVGLTLMLSWDYMPEDLQSRFLSTFSDEYAYKGHTADAAGRTKGFIHGLELFQQHPVLGVGPDNFRFTWPGREKGFNAHNVYGQLLGELGAVGVFSFGLLLWMMYRVNAGIISRWAQSQASTKERSKELVIGTAAQEHERSSNSGNMKKGKSQTPSMKMSLIAVPSTQAVYIFVAQAVIQTVILMLFKGWADHNLYRYTWLWLAAVTVLCSHFFHQGIKDHGQA